MESWSTYLEQIIYISHLEFCHMGDLFLLPLLFIYNSRLRLFVLHYGYNSRLFFLLLKSLQLWSLKVLSVRFCVILTNFIIMSLFFSFLSLKKTHFKRRAHSFYYSQLDWTHNPPLQPPDCWSCVPHLAIFSVWILSFCGITRYFNLTV